MLITRILLILLGLWLIRQVLSRWRAPRKAVEQSDRAERKRPEAAPFDTESVRDAEFEEIEEERDVGGGSR